MMAKMGRPTAEPKTGQIHLRISEKEAAMIAYCCDKMNMSISEVVLKGIDMVFNSLQQSETE